MKQKPNKGGLVYSTDPDLINSIENQFNELQDSATPTAQNLIVRMENKHRGGKTVTIVSGYQGSETEMEKLGKTLKANCGTGGTVKDGLIIIQGDQRAKVLAALLKMNYKAKRGN